MIGILTDKGQNDKEVWFAYIDGVMYECLDITIKYLAQCKVNEPVEYSLTDDPEPKIKKIAPQKKVAGMGGFKGQDSTQFTTADKLKKAGFGTGAPIPTAPQPDPVSLGKQMAGEIMQEAEVEALKKRADEAARTKTHHDAIEYQKEQDRIAAKKMLERDERMLREAQSATVQDYPLQNLECITDSQTSVIIPPGFAIAKSYSNDEMVLLRNVIAKDCTEPEFKLMMYMAHEYGLDPLLKQIWAVKRQANKPALIFVGRDGMLKIAHRSMQFDGMQSGVVYEGEGKDKKPVSAWCEIWRKDMSHSFKSEVLFSEYAQTFGAWLTHPSAMIIKVAEAVGLRKAFVVSGIYDPDEFPAGV